MVRIASKGVHLQRTVHTRTVMYANVRQHKVYTLTSYMLIYTQYLKIYDNVK